MTSMRVDESDCILLVIASLLSAFIGYEREVVRKAAGLRTHILVGTGACLISLVDLHLCALFPGTDAGRLSAQVISGIGFLGAGTIIQSRRAIRGLTTAASLWTVAGIGISVGIGMVGVAAAATVLVLISLHLASQIKRGTKG